MNKQVWKFSTKMMSLIIVGLIAIAPQVNASFEFSPIIANLKPSGSGASSAFTVTNTGANRIPVQVSIVAREPDIAGKEVYKETEKVNEMFRIFPSQIVLKPKETRTLRIRYVGSPKVKSELAFRIIAEELPVNVSDPGKVYTTAVAQVNITTRYIGSLYVTPSGAAPNVSVDVKRVEIPGKNLELTITNRGTSHQVIKSPIVRIKPIRGGKEIVLPATEVKSLVNQNILSSKTRKFNLAWPSNLPAGPVKASIDFSKR